MAEPSVKRWTIADLDALPETTDGWRNRYEIIDRVAPWRPRLLRSARAQRGAAVCKTDY